MEEKMNDLKFQNFYSLHLVSLPFLISPREGKHHILLGSPLAMVSTAKPPMRGKMTAYVFAIALDA